MVDDQFRKPLIPVFLCQLLLGEERPELRSDLELGDEQVDHIVGPELLDERMCCVIRVLGLGAPQRPVLFQEADEPGVRQVLKLFLRERHCYCHKTMRVVQPAARNTTTSWMTKTVSANPYSHVGPPRTSHSRQSATVTRLNPKVPNSAMPAVRYGRTTADGVVAA